MTDIAAALKRVEKILLRSPKTGLHADAPATAHWHGGTRVTTSHEDGTQVATDLPTEVGGGGTAVTPGWYLRAALASCLTTTVAMQAAMDGIELSVLEVIATSNSDFRGVLGMPGTSAGPRDLQLHVKIAAADGSSAERLRSLVERSHGCAPVSCAVKGGTPIELRIEVG